MTFQIPESLRPGLRLHYVSYDVYKGDTHVGLVFYRASDNVWVGRPKHGLATKHDTDLGVVLGWLRSL